MGCDPGIIEPCIIVRPWPFLLLKEGCGRNSYNLEHPQAYTFTDLLSWHRHHDRGDLSLLSGEGCFQPGARSWKGGCIWLCPKFVPGFVRTCTENPLLLQWLPLSVHMLPIPINNRNCFVIMPSKQTHILSSLDEHLSIHYPEPDNYRLISLFICLGLIRRTCYPQLRTYYRLSSRSHNFAVARVGQGTFDLSRNQIRDISHDKRVFYHWACPPPQGG